MCMEECQTQHPKPLYAHSLSVQHPCSCSSLPPDVILVADVTTSASQLHHISMEVATDTFIMFPFVIVLQKIVFVATYVVCFSDQEERTKAIEAFKEGKKDVLVATDVASKGLDFPAIQHVVNYDMPEEIENYGKRV